MISFYKKNIDYLTAHAVDPDQRRYSHSEEAARHYIDLDHYGKNASDSVPKKWKEAVKKYSEDSLNAYGIVPWHIEMMMNRLTAAFKEGNVDRILYLSANLGHYVEDAHVPLHAAENYNGQLTHQTGIHGLWEARIPELLSDQWDFFVGRANYIDKVNEEIWKIIKKSNLEADSALKFEAKLNSEWDPDKKYSFEKKGSTTAKVYSSEYAIAYEKMMDEMVERKMRESIIDVGSFWYTAWVNAGEPDLDRLLIKEVSDSLKEIKEETEQLWKSGKPLKGHEE